MEPVFHDQGLIQKNSFSFYLIAKPDYTNSQFTYVLQAQKPTG